MYGKKLFKGSGKPGKLREFHFAKFVSTLKGQDHNVSVDLQTERNVAATDVHVRKLRWIFPAVMVRRTSNSSDAGFFFCLTFPRPLASGRWVFLGVGFYTLVSAGNV